MSTRASLKNGVEQRKWVRNWAHAYPEYVATLYTPEEEKAICEEGHVFRLKGPAPAPVSSRPDPVRPWARMIFERQGRAAVAAYWPSLKQEIIAGALKPARVNFLIETYGFDALAQFE